MRSKILEKREVAKDTWEMRLARPRGFDFRAGQFCEIVLPELRARDARGAHREFSIASSPREERVIRIAFRNTKSGFKKTLLGMKYGNAVKLDGPFGQWSLPESVEQPLLFIAGGIGITPFMSMMSEAQASKKKYHITLFAINREFDSIPYRDKLGALGGKNVRVIHYLGRPGKKEFLGIPGIKKSKIYVAGPPGMVQDVVAMLRGAGLSQKNVIVEEFSGYL